MKRITIAGWAVSVAMTAAGGMLLLETKPKIEKPAGKPHSAILGVDDNPSGTAPQGVPGTEATVDLREWTKGESDGRDHQHEATAANSGGVDKPRLPLTSSDGPDAPKPDSTGRPRVSEANAETAKLQAETNARPRPVHPPRIERVDDSFCKVVAAGAESYMQGSLRRGIDRPFPCPTSYFQNAKSRWGNGTRTIVVLYPGGKTETIQEVWP